MATTYSNDISGAYATPSTKVSGAAVGGRLRRLRGVITLASQADGDVIVLGKLPAGSIFAYGVLNASATLGTATIAVGVSGTVGKYRADAVFTAAAPTLFGLSSAADDAPLSAEEEVIVTVDTAALPSSGTLVVDLYYSAP
jgi:hypothetical protein